MRRIILTKNDLEALSEQKPNTEPNTH